MNNNVNVPPINDRMVDMLVDIDIKEEIQDKSKPARNSPSLNLNIEYP